MIPGHFRLGRLNEAGGVCGGRVELWVLNIEFCLIEQRSLREWGFRVCWHRYGCLFFLFSREKTHFECAR